MGSRRPPPFGAGKNLKSKNFPDGGTRQWTTCRHDKLMGNAVIQVDVPDIIRIDNRRLQVDDERLKRLHNIKQRHTIQSAIGKTKEPDLGDARDLLCAFRRRQATGQIVVYRSGAQLDAIGHKDHFNTISHLNMACNHAAIAQRLILAMGGYHQVHT